MANYLQMAKRQQVLALLELGWSFRRIEAETGVRRETISRYDAARRAHAAIVFPGSPSNAANVFAGSGADVQARARPRASAAAFRTVITEKLDAGLSVQRIWPDLAEEFGCSASYDWEATQTRDARALKPYRLMADVFTAARYRLTDASSAAAPRATI